MEVCDRKYFNNARYILVNRYGDFRYFDDTAESKAFINWYIGLYPDSIVFDRLVSTCKGAYNGDIKELNLR